MLISYTMWRDIASALTEKYRKIYLTTEQYLAVNPLYPLVIPEGTEEFFGTKTHSLYIVATPVGWQSNEAGIHQDLWPPEGYIEAVQRHNESYGQFANYQTKVWVDFNIVKQVMEINPTSRFKEMMEATDTHIQQMCSECLGLQYMGRIENYIEANYFFSIIEGFLQE